MLDVLLRRGHPLPLPHLVCPSLSFLIAVSPRFYLSVARMQSRLGFASHDNKYNAAAMIDVDQSTLRRLLVSCLEHQLHSIKTDPTTRDEDLFAVASLRLAHTPSSTLSSPPTAPTSVSATPTGAPVSFNLTQRINADPAITEEHIRTGHYNIPENVRRTFAYELPIQNGVQWLLDIQMCSLPGGATGSERSDSRGIWLRQPAVAAIAHIVGASMLNIDENLRMLQGMPVIADEVHDPLGLGVNIGYPSGPRTPKYSWFDYLVSGPIHLRGAWCAR